MTFFPIRDYRKPSGRKSQRYQNFTSQVVDGVVKLQPSAPVVEGLAAECSISMNALRNAGKKQPLRQRMNVDAVDLFGQIQTIS